MAAAPDVGRRVVVGVDALGNAAGALLWAAGEAAQRGATLCLVHALYFDGGSALIGSVGEPAVDPARSAYVRVLARAERQVHAVYPDVPVVAELVHGGTAEALIGASARADVLVVGTHGHGGLVGLVLGSVSQRVILHSHCPVVVVRSLERAVNPSGDVVLAMDHDASQAIIRFAFEAASRAGAAVRAVHAWAPYPGHAQQYVSDTDILARQAAEEMAAAVKDAREEHPSVPVTMSVVRGDAAAVLAAASHDARLTVVGIRHQHSALSLGISPVITELLAHAESPIAVVPEA